MTGWNYDESRNPNDVLMDAWDRNEPWELDSPNTRSDCPTPGCTVEWDARQTAHFGPCNTSEVEDCEAWSYEEAMA